MQALTNSNLAEQFQQIFGGHIKARRRELRLTQLELSERLHISRTMLANIEMGTQRTSVFLLARLVQTLEISIEDLVPSITEAEARLKQNRKVFLATENKPPLLNRELEALNISLDSGSTLKEAIKEVRRPSNELKTNKNQDEEGNNG